MNHTTFPCTSCGADLQFKAGTNSLECPYCRAKNEIQVEEQAIIEENDYHAFLDKLEEAAPAADNITLQCSSCGAQTTLEKNVVASACPFCSAKIVAQNQSVKTIKPASLLPFKITGEQARTLFKKWLAGRWFMPNKVKKFARDGGLTGIYCPYWTYNANTATSYSGKRGIHYYQTEHYTETVEGREVTKERQVRKTRWYSVSGRVFNSFDDIPVIAGRGIPKKLADNLEPWDFTNLVPYQDDYLSGFRVESYTIGLKEGFEDAKAKMAGVIESSVKQDIGGDEQRIQNKQTGYSNISFKHILLPVWISSYRYGNKVYQYLVNARTGEVQGERPWSAVKIILAVLAGIGAAAAVALLIQFFSGS